jgi:hypothetical protein
MQEIQVKILQLEDIEEQMIADRFDESIEYIDKALQVRWIPLPICN